MADKDKLNKLVGYGQIALGIGFVLKGLADVSNNTPALLGKAPLALPRGNVIEKVTTKRVGSIDARVEEIRKLIVKGSLHPAVREKALEIVSKKCGEKYCIQEKSYQGEIDAIFWAIRDPKSKDSIRYVRDHVTVDQFHGADKLMQLHAGDCFVKGTLVLRDDHQLVPIESLRVGDKIWGRDRWSAVVNTWEKGILPTWSVQLNNGSAMRLTPDHKVWVADCGKHTDSSKSRPCACPVAERNVLRVTVRELRKGQVLLQPERIPFGTGEMDPGRAYVEGLYLSDGWSEPHRFSISGKDGHPKEAQKREVEAICTRLGIPTRWHKRYVTVKDAAWAARLATMGSHAPQKDALSINWSEGPALGLLRGIMADSGKNTNGEGRTFTTTSRKLWLQTRVLLKMAGVSASERYIVDHGGLGTHPIWRLGIRAKWANVKAERLLRVKDVVRDGAELPCFDIETDDHYVWLPEADWTTSQCDDFVVILGALLRSIGYPVKLRIMQAKGADSWSHIYMLVGSPPTNPTRWTALDASVESAVPGWQAPGAEECAKTGKPAGMTVKVKDYDVT